MTRQFTTAGTFIVTCTVSDMKGGTVTRNKLITVGSVSTFTISGRVTRLGQGLSDVVVTANNANGVISDADGYFTIPNLSANTYTLTPLLYGYTFSELFNNSITVGPSFTGADFDATAQSVVTITALNPNANEAAPVTPGTFRLTRTGDLSQDLVVNLNTLIGSSVPPPPVTVPVTAPPANLDYNITPAYVAGSQGFNTFTIPADSDVLDVTVTPLVDALSEGPETVILQLGPGNGYLVGSASSATVVIGDDDTALPKVGITVTRNSLMENIATPGLFTVSRAVATASPLTVNYAVSGSAGSGGDFTALTGSVTILAGNTSVAVEVAPVDDSISESLETAILTLSTNAAYIIDPLATTATVSLYDNDLQTVNVTASDSTATEVDLSIPGAAADTGTFLITRSGDTTNALTVYYAFSGVSGSGVMALHGADYEWMPGVVQIPAGQSAAAITVVPRFDSLGEGEEQVVLNLGASATNYILGSSAAATVTIADNAADVPYIDVVNTAVGLEPGTNANFRFSLRGDASDTPVAVNFTLGGNAVNGTDYNVLGWWLPQTSGSTENLRAIWAANATNLWAVGDNGTILKGDGTSWTAQTSGTTQHLRAVWGTSTTNLWAVGDGGTILKGNGTTWTAQTSGTTNALRGIWGSSATSIFTVGDGGTILRSTNGTSWAAMSSGITTQLRAVHGSGTTNTWAVGAGGVILSWNGTTWAPQTSGTSSQINAVFAANTTNIWAVGSGGVIQKGNGTTWAAQTSPNSADLNAVWASSTTNLLVSGASSAQMISTNGSSWSNAMLSALATFNGVWGTSSTIGWAVGDGGVIFKRDNATATAAPGSVVIPRGASSIDLALRTINDADFEDLESISLSLTPSATYQTYAPSSSASASLRDNDNVNTLVVDTQVGTGGSVTAGEGGIALPVKFYISRLGATTSAVTVNYTLGGTATAATDYDGGIVYTTAVSGVTSTLRDVWGLDASNIWAVGDGGVILKWNGTAWSAQTSGITTNLLRVWGVDANNVWAVGNGGVIRKWNGTTWAAQTSGTASTLRSVWGTAANNVWAVGDSGVILKWNGTAWAAQTSGTTSTLNAVWVADATNVWVVGNGGLIRKWDGTAWAAQTSGTANNLTTLWGADASNVWAAGNSGTLLNWNGSTWAAQTTAITDNITALSGTDTSNLYAVAGTAQALITGSSGARWMAHGLPIGQAFFGVWRSSGGRTWGVGANGSIVNWDWNAGTPLTGSVVIPAGATGVDLPIRFLDDGIAEGAETITFDFAPGAYSRGPGAIMYATDNDANTQTVAFTNNSAAGLENSGVVNVPVTLASAATAPVTVEYAVDSGTRTSTTSTNNTQPLPYWLRLVKTGTSFAAFASNDGVVWTQLGGTQTLSGFTASNYLAGLSVCSGADGTLGTVTFDNLTINGLSAGGSTGSVTSADIGAVAAAGSWSEAAGVYNVTGSGADIWGSADEFRYVWFPVSTSANCTITARITSQTNTAVWAKAGVMIRETSAAGSRQAMMSATPGNGRTFQHRGSTNGSSTSVTNTATMLRPFWLRLERVGDLYTASHSPNGSAWSTLGTPQTMTFGPQTLAGLAVSARNDNTTLTTATFDNVSLTGSPPFAGRTVGFVNAQGTDSVASGTYTLSAAGSQIGGTEDECHFLAAPVTGNFTLVARVLSQTGGNSNAQAGLMVRESTNHRTRSLYNGSVANAGAEFIFRNTSVTTAFGTGVDFALPDGLLTFAIGEQTKNIPLTITNDTVDEPNDNISLLLRNPNGAQLGTLSQFTYTILDDDNPPANPFVGFASATSSIGESAGTAQIAIALSSPATAAGSVDFATVNGSATQPDDYTTTSGTLSFAAGESVKYISVPITDDAVLETSEILTVTLVNPVNTVLGSASTHTLTITDDDSPAVSIVANDASASESGDAGQFTLTRNGDTTSALAVTLTRAGSATDTADYATISTAQTIPAGQASLTINVSPLQDTSNEGSETIILTVTNGSGYTLGTPNAATVNILDDDRSTVTLTANDPTASESGGAGQFTITRTAPTDVALTVNVTVAGTATNTNDYANVPATVAFVSGDVSKIINITPVDDGLTEGPEDVTISLGTGSYDIGASSYGSVSIVDNDIPPTVFIDSPSVQTPLIATTNGVIVSAQVNDDGTPSALTTTWSCVSGPGVATIESPNATTTAVSFTLPGTYVLRLSATDGQFNVSDQTTVSVGNAVTAGNWLTQDLGPSSSRRGQGLEYGGLFSLTGTGAGYAATSNDQAHVMLRDIIGDGSVVARVTSFSTTAALAGVTIRDSLQRGSNRAVLGFVPGTGLQFRTRATSGNDTVASAAAPALPFWLKLDRNATNNQISASYSTNGTAWTAIGTPVTVPLLNTTAYYGLTATSNNTATSATAVFDNVSLTPVPTSPALLNDDSGTAPNAPGSASFDGTTYTVAGSSSGYFYGWQYHGDLEIRCRLATFSSGAGSSSGGIRIAESIEGGAQLHRGRMPTSAYSGYYWTNLAGGGGGGVPSGINAGNWMRIVRRGNAITGFRATHNSTTGGPNAWTQIGQPQTIIMTTPVWVGFYVNNVSGATGTLNTCTFTGLSITALNKAPVVAASASGSISPLSLDGTITDDDLPAAPTSLWSKRSGPAGLVFANAALTDTTATLTESGTFGLRLTADDTGTKSFFDLNFTAYTTPFAQWLDQSGTGNENNPTVEATADADGDGVVNLLEYAVGTNGVIQNASPQVVELTPVSGDQYLRLSIPKNPAATDVTFIVEASSDLVIWSSAGLLIETNTANQLVVRDTIAVTSGVPRFMRVRVTR
jgi:regulation of enolase protein 1 (concanavalin A-like superfamily)